ncbi:hypothetical protein [Catellatospora tritici]|uniref:hypothetical protein n=1 Tax=Catellatospora tritici TaxID=2851566 RepID=UPI001C2D68B7|nr:hypothetical protein [Catellatospora tritici]MBV1849755.1 hypothetical protein [Catellatospora tritici]
MSYPPPYDPNQAQPQQPPQYGQYGAPISPIQQPAKKSNAGMIIGIIVGVVLLLCAACGIGGWILYNKASDKAQEIVDSLPSLGVETGTPGDSHSIHYTVEGSGEALITWNAGTGSPESETVTLPWSKTVVVDQDTFAVSVMAFGRGADTKLDTCTISIDGTEKKRNTGSDVTVVCTAIFMS